MSEPGTAPRAALRPARGLEPTDDGWPRARARGRRAAAHPGADGRPEAPIAAAVAFVVSSCNVRRPSTRAATDDVYREMTDGLVRDVPAGAPGRAFGPTEDAPDWVRNAGGVKRLVRRERRRAALRLGVERQPQRRAGNSVGIPDSVAGWRPRARCAQGACSAGELPADETTGRPRRAATFAARSVYSPRRPSSTPSATLARVDADDEAGLRRRGAARRRGGLAASSSATRCRRRRSPTASTWHALCALPTSSRSATRSRRSTPTSRGCCRAAAESAGARGVAQPLGGALRGTDPDDRGLVRNRVERRLRKARPLGRR